jgi:acetylornithine/succinyldiaminopimelate/putrescine aminotransferase
MVLKISPPLVVKEREADEFVRAVGDVVETMHSSATFWSEALGLAKRVMVR